MKKKKREHEDFGEWKWRIGNYLYKTDHGPDNIHLGLYRSLSPLVFHCRGASSQLTTPYCGTLQQFSLVFDHPLLSLRSLDSPLLPRSLCLSFTHSCFPHLSLTLQNKILVNLQEIFGKSFIEIKIKYKSWCTKILIEVYSL